MKILLIGQLPKEIGGNYTTGAANVILELSKKTADGVRVYTFGTNIPSVKARKSSTYQNQYFGYSFKIIDIIKRWILHPFISISEWKHYINVDHENPLRYELYRANIEEVIDRVKPDLIHVHSIGNVSVTRFAIGNRKIPILLTCHGIFYRGSESSDKVRDKWCGNVKLADYYSGLTQESLDEYESLLGIPRVKVTIIPNGVDCSKFYYDPEARRLIRTELNVSDKTKVLITVASVQERKGQFAFIKLLEQMDADYQYWIVGGGPDVPDIEKYVAEHKLTKRVKLLGYHTAGELYRYYSAADIYAHVSTMEGQALCEIEANATGLRTIINKKIIGTIPDINAGDYYIYDSDNPNLTELNSYISRNEIKRESRVTFDWQVVAEMYAELYKQIIIR